MAIGYECGWPLRAASLLPHQLTTAPINSGISLSPGEQRGHVGITPSGGEVVCASRGFEAWMAHQAMEGGSEGTAEPSCSPCALAAWPTSFRPVWMRLTTTTQPMKPRINCFPAKGS